MHGAVTSRACVHHDTVKQGVPSGPAVRVVSARDSRFSKSSSPPCFFAQLSWDLPGHPHTRRMRMHHLARPSRTSISWRSRTIESQCPRVFTVAGATERVQKRGERRPAKRNKFEPKACFARSVSASDMPERSGDRPAVRIWYMECGNALRGRSTHHCSEDGDKHAHTCTHLLLPLCPNRAGERCVPVPVTSGTM